MQQKGKGMPMQNPYDKGKGKGGFDKGKGKGGPQMNAPTMNMPASAMPQQPVNPNEQPGGIHSPEAAAKHEADAEAMMSQANQAVDAVMAVPTANGGVGSLTEPGVELAVKSMETLSIAAQAKVKEAQEFIMKKLQECSRVQTPSFAKLKASLPKKLSALAQAQPKITKARAEVQKAADDIQLQKSMSELQSKFAAVEAMGKMAETNATQALEVSKAEGAETDKVFAASADVYAKKEEFQKLVSDLKTQITGAVRQTMGQKSDPAGGLKKGAHELLINIATLESKVNPIS